MDPGSEAGVTGGGVAVGGAILSLTPAQHGTDGFFAAVLERVKVPK
jgi:16S rRNA C967 or C1407 C5-methylase (RsmB/RsmF family)